MHTPEVINVYEMGLCKRTLKATESGEIAPQSAPSLWRRVADFGAAVIDVARESRELEAKLLLGRYRRMCDS